MISVIDVLFVTLPSSEVVAVYPESNYGYYIWAHNIKGKQFNIHSQWKKTEMATTEEYTPLLKRETKRMNKLGLTIHCLNGGAR
jgi:hypothetical protein